jgi:hypothetical protein
MQNSETLGIVLDSSLFSTEEAIQCQFITLVDQILAAKKHPPSSPLDRGELSVADTSALEKQIDELVYALYGLTPEEIEIVEGKG